MFVLIGFQLLDKIPDTHSLTEHKCIWFMVSEGAVHGWLPDRNLMQKGMAAGKQSRDTLLEPKGQGSRPQGHSLLHPHPNIPSSVLYQPWAARKPTKLTIKLRVRDKRC